MTRLSVNINKIALIRNSRGGNNPDIVKIAMQCESWGADGITVHPRPDQRHIRYDDLQKLKDVVTTEFNIEGYPSREFIDIVLSVKPDQVTLVPDPPGVLTSSEGWDTISNLEFLKEVVTEFQSNGIRVSLFAEPISRIVEHAALTGTDRIEFYTGPYAANYMFAKEKSIHPFIEAAKVANKLNLGINAGHDLNLDNLNYFCENIPKLLEVSIGHALVCDSLYYGLQNTIHMYLRQLRKS